MAERGEETGARATRPAQSVRPVRRTEVRLPELRTHDGGALETEGDYDGLEFADADLSGQSGRGARFLDCAVRRCVLDGTVLSRARFIDSVLEGVRGVGTDLSQASLRDVEITDARLGGAQLHGAALERVVIRGGKIDFLNLRRAKLKDVAFEGCVLVEADFGGAQLERVSFADCTLTRMDFSEVRMRDVDLRGTAALDIARGIDRLAGAVISPAQLMDLAPAFAAQVGVRVE
ncbi:pentapeptide repeat-containing protein [Streptomyces sp. MST-110588]|uniref:pentapeptide repeat-containing protein n=1 Tax=Streptomyces sp. MST-110588 TaxID=2833628 RepID=UPI001F5D559B|nr:pentapeptide repeat-containing protein [Streptomyces sp. MST-110588]UNO40455.1 pentapeptide repeat-containing protein [Streptomyces sp. MST-110588]